MSAKQTTLCVPLEVKPESCSRLSSLINDIRIREDKSTPGQENFARIIVNVPTLHFLSMSVFAAGDYDPMFILEANFDGPVGVFWGQMEAALSNDLREIVRCCKRPLDGDGKLYDAVTAPESAASIAAYFEKRTQSPSVFHHGNRGMNRDRILREHALFLTVRRELDAVDTIDADPYRGLEPRPLHEKLRQRVIADHPWLAQVPIQRISASEKAFDVLRLLLYVVILIFILSLPGLLLALLLPTAAYVAFIIVAAVLVAFLIYRKREPLPGTGIPTTFSFLNLLWQQAFVVAAYVIAATLLLVPTVVIGSYLIATLVPHETLSLSEAFWLIAPAVALGLFSLIVTVPLIILRLRYLEMHDSSHDAPQTREHLLREMIRREDWVAQNHMGSIVLLKPGVLRTAVVRAGHLGLGLLLRVQARDGYLGSMRTVHFAHWAFLNNGSRLLFFSNFDHSWDSYLDDFIEKAHAGLTLAWGCGVGFPPTRLLLFDGASHGRRFKNWALASRTVSRFWYSAYPTLTVDQIERNYRIASVLHKQTPSDMEVRQWMLDL
ncbi:hypothetical protein QO002_004370 [Pararhizobium capsulatum DSM 1112]|uniref:Uncharacterized protein n=1 Tax=Pararhizobium capsulatum DSM 1112 TaxID=1121113 RepID=A0ABU0BWU8_9HYPH|nr:hypothetical protein [Pararhizobium capsulatum]MDQ0322164.1 hypothetical protein [Pararhizobium capsulatum DSM 1112]